MWCVQAAKGASAFDAGAYGFFGGAPEEGDGGLGGSLEVRATSRTRHMPWQSLAHRGLLKSNVPMSHDWQAAGSGQAAITCFLQSMSVRLLLIALSLGLEPRRWAPL